MSPDDHRPLAQQLQDHAVRRGRRHADAFPLTPQEMFALVRDMPYARASSHDPHVVIEEWRGTCSTKHELLAALLAEAGLRSTIMACTQEVQWPAALPLPPELADLFAAGRVVDLHNYLVVHAPAGDTIIDATWPLALKRLGLPANETLEWGTNMPIACVPLQTWAVPADEPLETFKTALLRAQFTPAELARRDTFIRTVGALLSRV